MDGFVCLTIVVVIGLLGYWWNGYCSSTVTPDTIRSTHAARRTGYEFMSSLPTIYYVLAIFCGVVLIGFTIANSGELSGSEIGYMIGWIFGSVLSMFAVGRVIELLQQIRDAVRNIPALSPGKPDDE
jgi:Na+/H+-translocating membrane pyrophosphatase